MIVQVLEERVTELVAKCPSKYKSRRDQNQLKSLNLMMILHVHFSGRRTCERMKEYSKEQSEMRQLSEKFQPQNLTIERSLWSTLGTRSVGV